MCADLGGQLDAFRTRPLDHIRLPGLFFGVWVLRRQDDAVEYTISMSAGFCVTASSAGPSVGMLLCVGFSPRCTSAAVCSR